MPRLQPPELAHVCDLEVTVDPVREVGPVRAGLRRIIPIAGGTVTGPRLRGRIVPPGADWQTVSADGVAELDARYAIETEDGALLEIATFGYRHGPEAVMAALARGHEVDPGAYYMRLHVRLETGDARYAWVNRTAFVATGARVAGRVALSVFALE